MYVWLDLSFAVLACCLGLLDILWTYSVLSLGLYWGLALQWLAWPMWSAHHSWLLVVPVCHRRTSSYGSRESCAGLKMQDTSWAHTAVLALPGQKLQLCTSIPSQPLRFLERVAGEQTAKLWTGRHATLWMHVRVGEITFVSALVTMVESLVLLKPECFHPKFHVEA